MKRFLSIILLTFVFISLVFVVSCSNKDDVDTTVIETTEKSVKKEKTKKKEKVSETTADTTSETTAETTAAPETTPETQQVQVMQGGTLVKTGGSTQGYNQNSNDSTSGYVQCPQAASTKDAFGGYQYILTNQGKKLTHTYSDRAVMPEDNSTSWPYMPIMSSTVIPDASASYNVRKALLESIKPGFECNNVIVGYDGYMFYSDTIDDYLGIYELSQSIYDRTVDLLKSYNNWAKANGMRFYLVIAPNKNTVYPQYMPETYTAGYKKRYEQFLRIINQSGITAIDLRDAMKQSVEKYPAQNLYYKYDTHWNNHAGYIAYQTTMSMIRKDYPNAIFHNKSEYQVNYCETYMKDQAYYLGYYSYFKDYGPVYTLKSNNTARFANTRHIDQDGQGQWAFAYECTSGNNSGYSDKLHWYQYVNDYNVNAPNAYILRDSYSVAMAPFLKDSFHRSTYNWTFNFDGVKQEILDNGTNVILMVIAERNLSSVVNFRAIPD